MQSSDDCSQQGGALKYPGDNFVFRPLESIEEDTLEEMED